MEVFITPAITHHAVTLTIDGNGQSANTVNTFSGMIASVTTANLSVVMSGSSTQVFSGQNAYTGNTTISNGALEAIDGIGLPTNSLLIFSSTNGGTGGVFQSSGYFSRSLGATTLAATRWSGLLLPTAALRHRAEH